ncbi:MULTISPECIES: hypothetical protein [Serratia]|nr:hypothetical protein [Serratia marcescens]ELH4238907.1 hypothetical protein [Serratia marcescens]ELM0003402.1 hypothetical protein [Serratia marcescens]MBH3240642.1 hypothetical protein [Serratia marcescens]MBN5410140.1 hypothetical protein [Serratia marcescens]MDP8025464.1 hypothetical protein [Serratia marcescens]
MVQRYNPDYVMHAARFAPFARENEHGEFVKFSDYEVLKAERDALAQRVEMLAVENSALKSRSIKLFNLGYLRGHESTVEGYFVDVHRNDIDTYHDDVVAEIIEDEDETPATDAALAAIQAQGVEKAIERLMNMFASTGHIGVPVMALEGLAKELREAK